MCEKNLPIGLLVPELDHFQILIWKFLAAQSFEDVSNTVVYIKKIALNFIYSQRIIGIIKHLGGGVYLS